MGGAVAAAVAVAVAVAIAARESLHLTQQVECSDAESDRCIVFAHGASALRHRTCAYRTALLRPLVSLCEIKRTDEKNTPVCIVLNAHGIYF